MNAPHERRQTGARLDTSVGQCQIGGWAFDIVGDSPLIQSLARFYTPFFELSDPRRAADITIHLHAGDLAELPVTDMRAYRTLPRLVSSDNVLVYRRDEIDMSIVIDPRRRTVEITGRNGTEVELQARVLVRDQLLVPALATSRGVVFHASAVQRGGSAFVFMGPRSSGKTTGMLTLMEKQRFDVVSCDRVVLDPGAVGPALVFGIPARCNLWMTSLSPYGPLAGVRRGVDNIVSGKGLVHMAALGRAFGVQVKADAPLARIVFPNVVDDGALLKIERVADRARLIELLTENLMEGESQNVTHPVWVGLVPPSAVDVVTRVRQLAERLFLTAEVLQVSGCYDEYVRWLARGAHTSQLRSGSAVDAPRNSTAAS